MIVLQEKDLVEQLQQVADNQETSVEVLLNNAVAEFLENIALRKIQDETVAFERMHGQLVTQYLDEYVAVHNGMVVDHDADVRTLHLRMRAKFGQMPILLRQVTKDVNLPALVVRSPKLTVTDL